MRPITGTLCPARCTCVRLMTDADLPGQVKAFMAGKPTAMTHQMASLKGTFTMMSAQGKLKKDPKAALDGAYRG